MDDSMVDRDARVGELLDAYLQAARGGRPMVRDEFLAAHPEVAGELKAALVGFEFVRGAGGDLDGTDAARDEGLPTGTLGDFRLVREVGRGGMAVVYEADQISLDRKVALKVLPFASVLDDRQLRRFKQEAQSAALLHHTNIVPVYSVGSERGVHYYAMQFIDGRTLADVIRELRESARERTSEDRAPSSAEALVLTPQGTTDTPDYCRAVARLGVQAAEALDHAHGNGVVHRDVKPANLLLDARGHVWIADFGLAQSRTTGNLTMTGAIVGTLRYMSPEQALAKRVPVDHRTDIYSLGVTLYEALTLRPAFPGEDAPAVIQDIAFRDPVRPHRLNPAVRGALETILLKAFAKDPETRYATAQEMADDLRRYLDDKPVLARRPPLLDRASLWARRHRAAVVAGAAVLVVSVAALATGTLVIAGEKRETERHLEDSRKHLADSKRSEARAEANFGKARDAVDRMLVRVGSKELNGIPGLERVKKGLLEDAIALYRGFLEESATDPDVQFESARAYLQLGRLYNELSNYALADDMLGQARALLVGLAPADGPWTPARHELVHVETERGRLLARTRPAESLAAFENAAALAATGALERPDDPHMADCLLLCSNSVVGQLMELGRFAAAQEVLGENLDRQTSALTGFPASPGLRSRIAATHRVAATLALRTMRPADAEDALKRALACGESIEIERDLGDLLWKLSRYDEAEGHLRKAYEASAMEASESPRTPVLGIRAANGAYRLQWVLRTLGRDVEAQSAREEALQRHRRFFAECEDVAELRPARAELFRQYSEMLLISAMDPEAEEAKKNEIDLRHRVVQAAPDLPDQRVALATALCQLQDPYFLPESQLTAEESLRVAREAVRLYEDSPEEVRQTPEWRMGIASGLRILSAALGEAAGVEATEDARRREVEALRPMAAQPYLGADARRRLGQSFLRRGTALRDARRMEEANRVFEEGVAIVEPLHAAWPGDPEAANLLAFSLNAWASSEAASGEVASGLEHRRRALELLEGLAARFPTNVHKAFAVFHASRALGRALSGEKRWAEAEIATGRAIDSGRALLVGRPGDTPLIRDLGRACYVRGHCLWRTGRPAEAEGWVLESMRSRAEVAELSNTPGDVLQEYMDLRLLGASLLDLERQEECEMRWREAASLVPRMEEGEAVEVDWYGHGSKWREVVERHGDTRALSAESLCNVARICALRGRPREACEFYERALEGTPGFEAAAVELIGILSECSDSAVRNPGRAVDLARQAVERREEEKSAWLQLGLALTCDGQWKDALAAYANARELGYEESGTDTLYQALAHARIGERELARALHDKAVAWLRENPAVCRDLPHLDGRRAELEALLGLTVGR